MKRRTMLASALVVAASVFAAPAFAAFPDKPVTVICPWTAGGGTDLLLRALSKEAEKFLGQTINVVNQTGGAGAIGHNAIRAARPDGYTIGMITFELNSLPPQGLVPFTWKDFDPLMRINTALHCLFLSLGNAVLSWVPLVKLFMSQAGKQATVRLHLP